MNETAIREEIVAPLLRHLGYRSGTPNNIIYEHHLTYPNLQLGRKKPRTDPPIRGKADYICIAGGQVRWTIEAKPPSENLDICAKEQAWSYANHPEVCAVYFALTNGLLFELYQTNRGPSGDPIVKYTYSELTDNLKTIENLLSPMAVLRDNRAVQLDILPPLAEGLRSSARVASGWFQIDSMTPEIKGLVGSEYSISDGSIQRGEDGTIHLRLSTRDSHKAFQRLTREIGVDVLHMQSTSMYLSRDEQQPTTFSSSKSVLIPAGSAMMDISDWHEWTLPVPLEFHTVSIATGVLKNDTLCGAFEGGFTTETPLPIVITISGRFEVRLA